MEGKDGAANVFIIGSKGIPGAYGGYETFVDKLTEYHQHERDIQYHVACKGGGKKESVCHGARCFHIQVPNIGPAQAIYYDVAAMRCCCDYIAKKKIPRPIVYILACRIGPFMAYFQKKIHSLGGKIYVNPDGHEWKRAKWSAPVKKYWKFSERLMTKHADLMVCDSENMERYIRTEYKKYNPRTTFIAYGAEVGESGISDQDEKLLGWYREKGLSIKSYYLAVGRFVPENNYETMIREFMKSDTKRSFALITNANDRLLEQLKQKTGFDRDERIKFVGTVYDKELLMKIRKNAYGYFHGHEVGGTNPSLLEALGSTELNLLLDVGFNREVAKETALYWTKESGSLAELIFRADRMSEKEREALGAAAKKRIRERYSWQYIADEYRKIFV